MSELTKGQITTLRRAAGILYDLDEHKLSEDIDRFIDMKTGRLDEEGELCEKPAEKGMK